MTAIKRYTSAKHAVYERSVSVMQALYECYMKAICMLNVRSMGAI